MPSIAIGMWCPASVRGLPSAPYLPIRGPSTSAPARPAKPPMAWTTPEPAKSTYPCPRCALVPSFGEPAAAPRPCAEQRVVDGAAEQAPADEGVPLPPLGHRAGRDRRRGVHEGDHVEEERHHADVVGVTLQEEAALPQEDVVAAPDERLADRLVVAEEVREAVAAEHECVADAVVGDEPEAEDREVRRHDVRGVLGTAEAGFDEREAGLHEDDEHRADDDPQQVQRDVGMRDLGGRGAAAVGRACPRGRRGQRDDRGHGAAEHERPQRTAMMHESSSVRSPGGNVRTVSFRAVT